MTNHDFYSQIDHAARKLDIADTQIDAALNLMSEALLTLAPQDGCQDTDRHYLQRIRGRIDAAYEIAYEAKRSLERIVDHEPSTP